ncbi:hypothetical protein L2E82_22315 [Cichorium intybus]|uniref:Uncharacterized protein n=1 Tax=Cichorium intybus TaxID=13427 RepID=A0ACB9DXG1_CICIN|nr:hypothetical protein L2E82_22315 [Cichorium intybus]
MGRRIRTSLTTIVWMVEESIGIIKNTNVADEQNEDQISPHNETNKNEDRIEEEVGSHNSGPAKHPVNPIEQSGCWPPLGDMADPVEPSSNSQSGPLYSTGPLDCEVNSLDLNLDPIESIEEQFLRQKNKDRKGKKSNKQTLVGFHLEGHEHMLRSEIEGEGISKVQK